MKTSLLGAVLVWVTLFFPVVGFADTSSLYDFTPVDVAGKPHPMAQYRGKVVLIVNTASQCGFTPQLKDLQALYKEFKDQGLVILAFPSNDFKQESGTSDVLATFAKSEYGVEFPIMDKGPVTGPNKQPIYKFLISQKPGLLFSEVKWNFEKFLVARDGKVLERWSSMTSPSGGSMRSAIEKALSTK